MSGASSRNSLIDKTIGSAYATVADVAGSLPEIRHVSANMAELFTKIDSTDANLITIEAAVVSTANSKDAAAVSETNAASSASAALISQTAAAVSEAVVLASEVNVLIQTTAAGNSAIAAGLSETAAANSKANAVNSENAAAISVTIAATHATIATTQATSAAASKDAAAISATNAAISATTAGTSEAAALASKSAAAISESNAANNATVVATNATAASGSATAAADSASTATTQATSATSSKNAAAISATNAASSEAAATTFATNAANSAIAASESATTADINAATATAQAGIAATQATAASASATSASTSASTATTKASEAATSATAAATSVASLSSVDNTSDLNKPVSTAQQAALNLKANLASPTFTGIPSAPTAVAGTNTTQIATMAAVQTAIANLVDSSPTALNTLNELAAALGDDPNFATTVTNTLAAKLDDSQATAAGLALLGAIDVAAQRLLLTVNNVDNTSDANKPVSTAQQTALNLKANLISPTFTTPNIGVATGTSFNSITGLSSTNPLMNSAVAIGTGTTAARADHVHPVDTSRAPLASPTFTGTPAAPTAAAGTSSTQLATTAFVSAEISNDRPYEAIATNIKINGTQSVGSRSTIARGDHVHPVDTSRAAVDQTTYIGTTAVALNRASAAQALTGITSIDGTATTLQIARTIGMTGDVTWTSAAFDGGANVTGTATLASTGVSAGTYPKVTVDAKGRVTGGASLIATDIPALDWSKITTGKPTTLAGYGITDVPTNTGVGATGTWGIAITGNAVTATTLQTARTINGVSFNGSANITVYDSTKMPLAGGTFTGLVATRTATGNTSTASTVNAFEVMGNATYAAVMSFHRSGAYAINMGLDNDNVFRIGGWSAPANLFQMDMAGNLTMANNITAYSDERLKKNWRSFAGGLVERMAAVKSGIYDRTDIESTQVGVSAQSLQTVLPEAVLTDEKGMLSVAYGNAALAMVIELCKEVVQLKNELAALRMGAHI